MQEMQKVWVQSLGWEEALEKEMVTHSSILSWNISWTEEPSGLQSMGHKESDTTEGLTLSVTESSAFMQYTGSVIKEIYILIS